jgi:hypothetical protein
MAARPSGTLCAIEQFCGANYVKLIAVGLAAYVFGFPEDAKVVAPSDWGLLMARWVLGCPHCHEDFTHSDVPSHGRPDLFMSWDGRKLKLPEGGQILVCPNCNTSSTYQLINFCIGPREL